jgi:UDP-sulfoquinovose synthase
MQGPVYGISTDDADMDERLIPNFHYDEIFGTVLNRFIVQAIIGYPLTVYGKGGQTRGYLNIKDTLQCVYLAATQPAKPGELRIFNQISESFSVNELAKRVKIVGKKLGYDVRITHLENPRKEKEKHYYNPTYTGLLKLGLQPQYLTDRVLEGMFGIVEKYKNNINRDAIFRGVQW